MHKIRQPVLCIFTNYDDQLPCEKVLQDWDVAINEKMENKQFEVYDGTHFSLFTHREQVKLVSDRIVKFIQKLDE